MSKFDNYTDAQLTTALNNPAISEGLKTLVTKELAARSKKKGPADELALLVGEPPKVVQRQKVASKDWVAKEIKLGQGGGALYSFGCKALYRPVDEYGVALSAEACIKYFADRGYQGPAVVALCNNPGWKVHTKFAQYQG